MIKTNVVKSIILCVLMAIMFMATSMTAYAYTDIDTENDEEFENVAKLANKTIAMSPSLPLGQQTESTDLLQQSTTNAPALAENRVAIITRAEQSGNPLEGVAFTVYRADDGQSVDEVITDADGITTFSLAQGEYYLQNDSVQYGFLLERSRIFFSVQDGGDITVEVTIQRDASIPLADTDNITVPKTGELPPIMNYLLGTFFLAISLLCGFGLISQREPKYYLPKGVIAYA